MAVKLNMFRSVPQLFWPHCRHLHKSNNSSVNPNEVSHFDNLASTWWDPYGSSRLLHQMNPLRHQFISHCLESVSNDFPTSKRRYLDIGCGGGIFAESAARLHQTKNVVGIDPSQEVISVAQGHASHDPSLLGPDRLQYQNRSIEDFPLPQSRDDMFDIVTLFEVIEHINQPGPFLFSCLPFVKPGGWLVLSTISRTWTSWLTTKIVAEDIIRLVPEGTHDWKKFLCEHELQNFFRQQEGWGRADGLKSQGCLYLPGIGWKFVNSGEKWGNYFFGVRRNGE